MIENDGQLTITQNLVDKFNGALVLLALYPQWVDPIIAKAQREGIKSVRDELQNEIDAYLKENKTPSE